MQAPESFGFVEVLRIRRLAAVDIEAVVAHEFKLLGLEQFGDISDTLIDALQEPFENLSRRAGLSGNGQVVQHGPILVKLLQVGLEEVQVQIVERCQVAIEEPGGDFVIQRLLQIMHFRQNLGRPTGDRPFIGHRLNRRQAARPALQ